MRSAINIFVFIFLLLGIHNSCTHDSFIMDDMEPDPMDTVTNPMDTMMVDTMNVGTPCDSNVIYFENEILPILLGSCAFAGCHDAASANDGVILDSYDNIINTAVVVPFDLNDSELYEVITENDPDKVMPPTGKLPNDKINLIAQWILQGSQNLECDENQMGCNTENVSYNDFIRGVFDTSCNGCHSTAVAFGGVVLDNYDRVKDVVDAGRLYGAINWDQGYSRMPQGQNQLDSCVIAKVKSWIDEGAGNN